MKSQSTNKMFFLIITAFIIPALAGCESIRYFKSELTGTAKPPLSESENRPDTSSGESSTEAPVSKTYSVSSAKLRLAALEVLYEQGYIYEENPSTGTIKTEAKLVAESSSGVALFGANYYAKPFIKIYSSKITYKAKFDKQSNLVKPENNLEYPEKEIELRRIFFKALDLKLGEKGYHDRSSQKSSRDDVYNVQKQLTEKGYQPGPIDGIMGRQTKEAIMQFQGDMGLTVTGRIDSNTLTSLNE